MRIALSLTLACLGACFLPFAAFILHAHSHPAALPTLWAAVACLALSRTLWRTNA